MRIAVNTRFLLPNRLEGMGWFTWEVLRRWADWEANNHNFFFLFDRPFHADFVPQGVEALRVFPPARHPFLWYAWYEWALPRVLRRLKPDVFVSLDNFCSLSSKVPTLLVIHDLAYAHAPANQTSGLTQSYYERFMPRYARRAEQIATVSEFSRQDIISRFQVDEKKVHLVYPGAQANYRVLTIPERLEARRIYAKDKPYFLYLGSIHPRKNLVRLLLAFDNFKQKTALPHQLVLAGRMAWQTGEVGETLAKMNHASEVLALGYVPQNQLFHLVGGAEVLCYVSLFEGFGLPILEGLQAGVPVLCSAVSSMPEVGGGAAHYVEPQSIDSITEGLVRLALDPAYALELSQKGPVQASRFNWDKTAKSLWELLLSMNK